MCQIVFVEIFYLPPFACSIIVVTKVHTGIVIVLSIIIILGRMLRLVKEINYIL